MAVLIWIKTNPFTIANTAYYVTQAILKTASKINCVFFSEEGVYIAQKLYPSTSKEFNKTILWQELAQKYQFPLYICSNSAIKRGILDKKNADYYYQTACSNIADNFECIGFGQLTQFFNNASKVLCF